jgi:predicted SprT family Zn-dependent metalloprotease
MESNSGKMSTTRKTVITIVLAVAVWFIWNALHLDPITSEFTPPEFRSTAVAAGVTPMMSQEDLKRQYASDNDEYFGGHLPKNTTVDYDENDPNLEGSTYKDHDGNYHISFNPVYTNAGRTAQYVLLHEMCHVEVWDVESSDILNPGGKHDHGRQWRSCMLRVDAEGAFRQILIDSYTEKLP